MNSVSNIWIYCFGYVYYVYVYIHILYNCVAFPQKTQKKQLNIYAYILVGFVIIVCIL